uniref:Microtubule associated protein 1S n=1 Tax=Hippocampus comes TaxID=109280 RepID=A0A3Q2ZGL7_HIPCM
WRSQVFCSWDVDSKPVGLLRPLFLTFLLASPVQIQPNGELPRQQQRHQEEDPPVRLGSRRPSRGHLPEIKSGGMATLSPASPFELLPPPATVGFLKLSRPCCYAFPAGRGDCAFFAVNGFTVLLDGGSDPRACFWKLVRHLDRVDALLLTHAGADNLGGVNSFLERKVAETQLDTMSDEGSARLISPELGVVFFNAPGRLRNLNQAAVTLRLLKELDIQPHPMFRPPVAPPEPITLFQKLGVGQLDLYILTPAKNRLPLAALASVSALLVWHPACPLEKVVRVLFPGITPQSKLLRGLETLKSLAFLRKPTVTTGDLERMGFRGKTKRTESQDSVRSQGKEVANKPGKEAKNTGKLLVTEKNGSKKASGKEAKKNAKQGGKGEHVVLRNGKGDGQGKGAAESPGEGANPQDAKTADQLGVAKKPAKVVGFPTPLKQAPKNEPNIEFDLTPTEYTLLDGALRTTAEVAQPNVSTKPAQPIPREKHLTFLSLGPLKDGASDPSASVANTTTSTHSMPAEVSSPQSTEVDESLSMSLESLASEAGRPPVPGALHFETTAHDVDLCLVSPCEFQHFKAPDSGSGDNVHKDAAKDVTPGESNAPVCTEECPSTTADGVLDSDEEESCGIPTNLDACQALPRDPLPARLRDSPPLPPHPDTTMPVPQSDAGVTDSTLKPSPGKIQAGSVITKAKKDATSSRASNTRLAKSAPSECPSSTEDASIFVDLAYVPSGAASPTVGVDFFKSVRSSCYVVSGDCPEREKLMRQTLDALLHAKTGWEHATQVTLIPTFESPAMQDWYQQTVERQRELGVLVLGSNSTVAMQDDTFPACKIEF